MRFSIRFWLALFILFSTAAVAETRPSFRVLTFTGDDPWSAVQTIYRPDKDDLYRTETIGALFSAATDPCNDLLANHQRRALEAMLKRHYITLEVFKELMNTRERAHSMRQYILATAFVDMPVAEASQYDRARWMEKLGGQDSIRVHMGSLFVLRGYDVEDGKVVPRDLPWQFAARPPALTTPFKRERVPVALEFGRALNESDAPAATFPLLTHFLVNAVAADLRVLEVDPLTVPVMAHVYQPTVAKIFSKTLSGRPMNAAMQTELENNPAGFLMRIPPAPENWESFTDTILVGPFAAMIENNPIDRTSAMVRALGKLLPLPPDARHAVAQALTTSIREDFAHQRSTIQLRDFGTALLKVKFMRILSAHGIPFSEKLLTTFWDFLSQYHLLLDPDFGQEGWNELHYYIPLPAARMEQKDMIPAMLVGNLPPTANQEYLGKLVLATAALIKDRIAGLTPDERQFVLREMNGMQSKRGRRIFTEVNLESFLATYDLTFATGHESVRTEIEKLGAHVLEGLRVTGVRDAPGAKLELQVDLEDLGLTVQEANDPIKFQRALYEYGMRMMKKHMLERVQPTKIFQFDFAEVEAQRRRWSPLGESVSFGAAEFHRQRLARHYITFQ